MNSPDKIETDLTEIFELFMNFEPGTNPADDKALRISDSCLIVFAGSCVSCPVIMLDNNLCQEIPTDVGEFNNYSNS